MSFEPSKPQLLATAVGKRVLRFAVGLFIFSAVMKLAFLQFKSNALYKPDPVFSVLNLKQLLLLSISAELGAVGLLLLPSVPDARKLQLLFLLATTFVGYKIALYVNGYNLTCNCLGQGMFSNETVRRILDVVSTLSCLILLAGSGYVLTRRQEPRLAG